jgi:hypothetical protein
MNGAPIADLARSLALLLASPASCLGVAPIARGSAAAEDARIRAIRRTVWRLRRAYDEATGDGEDVLQGLVARLSATFAGIGGSFPLWIDLIEDLTQDAERRFGTQPGRGALKAAQVKAAMRYLISRSAGRPAIALRIDSGLLSALLDASIDFVVMLLNRQDLWVDGTAAAPSRVPFRLRVWHWLVTRALVLFDRISDWLEPAATLSPVLLSDLDRIVAAHVGAPFAPLCHAAELTRFVAAHRTQIAALAELVASGCFEAETFLELSGPEKQAYGRDLILLFLEAEYGLPATGPIAGLTGFLADRLIDGVVLIFNKRGVFATGPRP